MVDVYVVATATVYGTASVALFLFAPMVFSTLLVAAACCNRNTSATSSSMPGACGVIATVCAMPHVGAVWPGTSPEGTDPPSVGPMMALLLFSAATLLG